MDNDRRYNCIMAGGIRRRKNVAVSRLKALISVIETFNKADALNSLGVASGALWSSVRGTWGIIGNKAVSGDSPSNYPLATLTFTKEDVSISVDGVGPGTGASFWVTDAGTWWGSVVDGVQQCQTCYNSAVCNQFFNCCNGTYNPVVPGNSFTQCTAAFSGNQFTYCISGTSNSGWNTAGGGTCSSWNTVVPGNQYTVFTCTSTNSVNLFFTVNYFCGCGSCGGSCTLAPSTSCGGTCCTSTACGGLSGPNGCKRCSVSGYNTANCAGGYTNTAWNASSGGNCAGTYNPVNPSTQWFAFVCNGGTATAWNSGSCYQWTTGTNPATGGNCNAFAFNCCSTYSPGNAFECNCVVNNRVKIIKSIGGTVSDVATFVFGTAIAGFRTILSGNTITVRAFSGTNYTGQIGSDQSTTVSGYTKTKKHGILKAPVTYSSAQSSEINEFRVS